MFSELPLRTLIIDDDAIDRMAVCRALSVAKLPIAATEASDAATALKALRTQPFDCILLEHVLLDQSGLSFIQDLRQQGTKIPILVLTRQGDEQSAVELMKAGASDYLLKSRVTPDILARTLRNAVRVYQAERQAALAYRQLCESNSMLRQKNQQLEHQQQQIQLQNVQLIEVSRLKSEFLTTMSHELRTPMNSIIGFSDILLRCQKGSLNARQIQMVDRIFKNATHLLTLIDEILDFSELETNRLNLQVEEFDLVELVNMTIGEMQMFAQQKRLNLELEINLQNRYICNDPKRLQQILIHLLSNAIKFTEVGRIYVRLNELQADRIAIAVQDTGIGIAAKHLRSIFEPFQQVDQTITRKQGGTGLGLAITRLLVQMMSGQICVESEVGVGSRFCLELPRRVVPTLIGLTHIESNCTDTMNPQLPSYSIHQPTDPLRTYSSGSHQNTHAKSSEQVKL